MFGNRADVSLVAAAPDLLEACKAWLKSIPMSIEKAVALPEAAGTRKRVEATLAAIAKAEGRAE
jgi:hypothetical protein